MDPNWLFARLRELRVAAGLTQAQLAEKAGFSTREGVAQIEGGRASPTWKTVIALCVALGVEPNEFARKPDSRRKPRRGRPAKVIEE